MQSSKEALLYDPTDKNSIVAYAQGLVGKSLREACDAPELADPRTRRGSLGDAIETYYFGLKNNSDSRPDFGLAGLELKSTPLKLVKRGKKLELVAKERLVLGMIDYVGLPAQDFEHSHVVDKCSDMLVISYLYERDKNPADYTIECAFEMTLPEEDLPQLRADFEVVRDKVMSGHAEDISGSDTMYLEACTKAANSSARTRQPFSDVPAKPRAWALKASYMTAIQQRALASIQRTAEEKDLTLLELVRSRFSPYFGSTEKELQARFGLTSSKNLCARITNRILGVNEDDRIADFEKAGIKPKTIRLRHSGRPKEAVSFPAFDYFELEATPFETSDFYAQLQQKYLFVLYRETPNKEYALSDVCFWQMPEHDYEEARRCYEQMRENVKNGRADLTVKSTENRCCHVRQHARNKLDVRDQPHGSPFVKQCFWLNQAYLAKEIQRALDDQDRP